MELLSEKTITLVNRRVYAKFPEVKGVRPTQKRAPSGSNVILTYRYKLTTEDGHGIERVVRATVAPDGQVVKLSTSR